MQMMINPNNKIINQIVKIGKMKKTHKTKMRNGNPMKMAHKKSKKSKMHKNKLNKRPQKRKSRNT